MSLISVAVKYLMEAGASPEQIVAAIADMEAADRPIVSRGAERMARYRSRGGDKIPPDMRRAVFERDGYACLECGSAERLCADHAVPVSKGGETSMENLQTLCHPCNCRKKDRIRKYEKRTFSDILGHPRTSSEKTGNPQDTLPLSPPSPNPPQTPQEPQPPHTPTRSIIPRARKAEPDLPDGVTAEQWNGFVEMRKRIKKPLTPHAEQLLIGKLLKLADDGYPPGDVLDQSTMNSWQGLFPIKELSNGRTNQPNLRGSRPDPSVDLYRAACAAIEAEGGEPQNGEDSGRAWLSLSANGAGRP